MILDYKGLEVHVLKSLFKIAVYKLLEYPDTVALTGTSEDHQSAHFLQHLFITFK